jgi:hypothetical protein
LADETLVELLQNDYSKPITADLIDESANNLIKDTRAHIDSLMERLKEPRVRAIVEPILIGAPRIPFTVSMVDKKYVVDLGLLKRDLNNTGEKPLGPWLSLMAIRKLYLT